MKGKSRPLVSVVTPVFNCEAYLAECIESVQHQDYGNWEYLIVNNCSTDRSGEIAEQYAARDSRIRVHHNQHFLDVIANHNHALRQMSPESTYCKLLFADDWLFPECLDKMVSLADRYPTIGIVGAYGIRGRNLMWEGLPYSDAPISGQTMCRLKLKHGIHVFGTGSSTLIRSEVIRQRHAFYNESNLHADTEACLEVLKDHDYGFVHQILVYIRDREALTSYSRRVNTYLAARLYELDRFGPANLAAAELRTARAECLRQYYVFLAKSVFLRRDKAFWQFHRAKLKDLGRPLSLPRLAVSVGGWIVDGLLNPLHALQTFRARRSRGGGYDSVLKELGA